MESKLNKNKLTKKVYYDGCFWKIKQVISPNKHQTFLLLKMETKEKEVYDDGTVGEYLTLIDTHNDEFWTDTNTLRRYVSTDSIKEKSLLKKKLGNEWLGLFIRKY